MMNILQTNLPRKESFHNLFGNLTLLKGLMNREVHKKHLEFLTMRIPLIQKNANLLICNDAVLFTY